MTPNEAAVVTPEEIKLVTKRYSQVRTRLLANIPFFGHLLMKLSLEVTRAVPLAAVTRDRHILLNTDWAMATTDTELAATAAHEMLHCAMLTFERQGPRTVLACGPDGMPVSLWNCAADYADNLIIRDMIKSSYQGSITMLDPEQWDPPGLIDEKYRGMSAEQIYDDLLANLKPAPKNLARGCLFLPGLSGSQRDMQSGSGGKTLGAGNGDSGEIKKEKQYWNIAVLEAAQIHKQTKVSSNRALPDAIRLLISELTDPKITWQTVLSRWVGENGRRSDHTYMRPNRRSESVGETLPSLKRSGCSDVTVLWDTSGSMGGQETKIMTEVLQICQDMSLSLRVICCDTDIRSDVSDVVDLEDLLDNIKGGGGSDLRPAFKRLDEEQYSGVLVAFTDGYIAVPAEKPYAMQGVLWVVWGQHSVDPTGGRWGETLFVDEDGNAR